jgi:archaeosine synthase alpha-subunit
MRALERLDGPTLLGEGTVGAIRLRLPGVLWASGPGTELPGTLPAGAARLETLPAPGPMRRAIRVAQSGAVLDLALEIPTPEVSGVTEGFAEAAERVLSVRTPLSASVLRQLGEGSWDLVVWSNARSTFLQSELFVRSAIALRQAAGPAPMLWAPRVALPGRLSFLFALGIDLVDSTEGLWAAAEGAWMYADHDELGEGPGGAGPGDPVERGRHVVQEYALELERVRRAARAGRLRELVEARLVPEPRRGELLRYYDRIGYPFQDEHAPVVGDEVRPYTTREALRRPEVERFRRRFLERYVPPEFKRTLLLVPCSRTKPYSNSPSHRRFAKALEGIPGLATVHKVSVTSPLGLVPRELECVYPARNYDIPVTGDWDEDEKRWVRDALSHIRSGGRYSHVIVHLPREEYGWLKDLVPEGEHIRWTVVEEVPTSHASLAALAAGMGELPGAGSPVLPPGGVLRIVRSELEALALFQFPAPLAKALFAGEVRLAGRPWFQRLTSERKEDLATWREETGLWRLTVAGAEKVANAAAGSRVEVRGGVELRGDLFAPGVASADPEIRIGDDVVLVRAGAVVGVGEARIPGPWMGRLPRGLAVKVRHRAHPSSG